MPRLKVCGVADAAFAVEAARRGVDCLGLIFAEGSPRRVTEERAREIVGAVRQAGFSPRFVGVFVKHPVAEIAEIVAKETELRAKVDAIVAELEADDE